MEQLIYKIIYIESFDGKNGRRTLIVNFLTKSMQKIYLSIIYIWECAT